ncbi:MAG: AIR synthase-related protein [Acidobacteriota bacterium]
MSAHAVGFARSEEWVGRDEVREGDRIIVTKWAGLEGTSILAREFPASLLAAGLSEKQMERSRNLIFDPGIGIVEEARVALKSPGLTALHDVTEGGIATALRELAQDCGCRFSVDPARIPVLPETQHICRHLGIDPLGLIGSGSLLILVRPTSAGALVRVIEEAGIPAAEIGRVEAGTGLVDGDGEEWKEFDVDELARVYPKLTE